MSGGCGYLCVSTLVERVKACDKYKAMVMLPLLLLETHLDIVFSILLQLAKTQMSFSKLPWECTTSNAPAKTEGPNLQDTGQATYPLSFVAEPPMSNLLTYVLSL